MKALRLALIFCLIAFCAFAQPSAGSRYPQSVAFTIAESATTSGAVNLAGCTAAAIVTPAALTGSTLTFSVSDDGGTWTTLYDEFGSAKSVTIGTSRTILLSPADFWWVRWVKLVSGSTEAAARRFIVICRN